MEVVVFRVVDVDVVVRLVVVVVVVDVVVSRLALCAAFACLGV